MSVVNYKFKCSLDVDSVKFDELFISVRDLKETIKQKKGISENNDLQLTNEKTNETYTDEKDLISDGTNLIVTRIPTMTQCRTKQKNNFNRGNSNNVAKVDSNAPPLAHIANLSNYEAPEEDKIKAIMYQSTLLYSPINYINSNGQNQVGSVPPYYQCYKCHKKGHWIKDCPYSKNLDKLKRTTGIPRSHLVPVDGPQVKGALMTENGSFAVPLLDHQLNIDKKEQLSSTKNTEHVKKELSHPFNEGKDEKIAVNNETMFSKMCVVAPPNISKEVCNLKPSSVENSIISISAIEIEKKTILPTPSPPVSTLPLKAMFDNLPFFIDFSKPPPKIPANFYSVKEEKPSSNLNDKMEAFLNDLRKREDKICAKHEYSHKSRRCSRSSSRSSTRKKKSSSSYRMASPKTPTRTTQRYRSKERKNQSRKSNRSHSRHHRFKEGQHHDKKLERELLREKDNWRDEQSRKSCPDRRNSYDNRKRRK